MKMRKISERNVKHILIIILTILLLTGCDALNGGTSSDNSENKEFDTSLKSLYINNEEIELIDGVTEYEYYLASSSDSKTYFEITGTATDHNSTVSGCGTQVIDNPFQVGYSSPYKTQWGSHKEFTIRVQSKNEDVVTDYKVVVSCAPAWAEAIVKLEGDISDIDEYEHILVDVWGLSSSGYYFGEYSFNRSNQRIQNIYIPLPLPINSISDCLYSTSMSIHINKGPRKYQKGSFNCSLSRLGLNLSKSKVYKLPEFKLNKRVQITVNNIPYSFGDGNNRTFVLRNVDTKERFPTKADYGEGDKEFLNTNARGTFDIVFKESDSTKAIYLGQHTLTDESELNFDFSSYTEITMSDLGPQVYYYSYDNKLEVRFSDTMNTSSVENNIKIYDAEKFCKGEADAEITIENFIWSYDNKYVEIISNPSFNNQNKYYCVIDDNAKAIDGSSLYFNEIMYVYWY